MSQRYSWFVKRDLDGFFGLFIDNLVQLLLIVQLCALCGITAESDPAAEWQETLDKITLLTDLTT